MADSFVFNNRRIVIPPPGREPPANPPLSPGVTALMNKAEPDFIVFAHFVPTRIFRVTAHKNFIRFRVEKLSVTSKPGMPIMGNWHTVRALAGQKPGEMLNQAMQEGAQAQHDFIQQRMKKQQMQKKQILRV
jgi:hypothetical protein